MKTEEMAVGTVAPVAWVSDLAFENASTIDHRWIVKDALTARELPLTLMAMTVNSGQGHVGSYVAGRIDAVSKDSKLDMTGAKLTDGMIAVRGTGVFDMGGENGAEIARLVEDETLRGVSVDLAITDYGFRDPETGEVFKPDEMSDDQWEKAFMGELDLAVIEATLVAATVCPTPAFDDARIAIAASAGPQRDEHGTIHMKLTTTFSIVEPEPIVAAAAPAKPPLEWFETPEANGPMPLTITEEGRVFGHLAPWDGCYMGLPDVCMQPPRSQSGYAYFHTGELETADGDCVAIGKLMFAGKHAPLSMSRKAAADHYDDNTHVGAYVRAHDGRHGIWVSGMLRPGLSDEEVQEIRANPPSGDWRGVNGSLEMIAGLAVPIPGYPIPRAQAALVASGNEIELTGLLVTSGEIVPNDKVVDALVASGALKEDEAFQMEKEHTPLTDNDARIHIEVLVAAAEEDPVLALARLAEDER